MKPQNLYSSLEADLLLYDCIDSQIWDSDRFPADAINDFAKTAISSRGLLEAAEEEYIARYEDALRGNGPRAEDVQIRTDLEKLAGLLRVIPSPRPSEEDSPREIAYKEYLKAFRQLASTADQILDRLSIIEGVVAEGKTTAGERRPKTETPELWPFFNVSPQDYNLAKLQTELQERFDKFNGRTGAPTRYAIIKILEDSGIFHPATSSLQYESAGLLNSSTTDNYRDGRKEYVINDKLIGIRPDIERIINDCKL